LPLRAEINGRFVNAAFLSDDGWNAIKRSDAIVLPTCGCPGYKRRSRRGTRHFAHLPKRSCGGLGTKESEGHLAAKTEIVKTCRELGWESDTEIDGPDNRWRADVLAWRGSVKLAFEVQLAKQTLEVTQERQTTYGKDAKCCWLFSRPPVRVGCWNFHGEPEPPPPADPSLPIFKLHVGGPEFLVNVGHWTLPLKAFVQARLSGHIRYKTHRQCWPQELQLHVVETECWRCHCDFDLIYTSTTYRSLCGAHSEITVPGDGTSSDDPYGALININLAKEHFESQLQHLRVSFAWRYSRTMGRSYWSFGCPQCDALCGDFFFHRLINENEIDTAPAATVSVSASALPIRVENPHWCFSESKTFCS
jgi:hypothetical protein